MLVTTMSASAELVTWRQARDRLSAVVEAAIPPSRKLDVIEAGCGRIWALDVSPERCNITGIDTDAVALDVRITQRNDLHTAVVGDVQDATAVPVGSSDLVYSSFVLEHLPRAEEAMTGWVSWLRPGGMLVAIVPDARSVYGFASRSTPHRLHVLAYRLILRRPLAGTPGHAPYPIAYSRLMTLKGLGAFAAEHDLEVTTSLAIGDMYEETPTVSARKRQLIAQIKRVASWLSFGRLAWRHDNIAVVMRRRDAVDAPA
jgi:SAM-dependent methyltransferase